MHHRPGGHDAPLPMVTPGRTVALAPIHTLSPMTMGAGSMEARRATTGSWFKVASTTL